MKNSNKKYGHFVMKPFRFFEHETSNKKYGHFVMKPYRFFEHETKCLVIL